VFCVNAVDKGLGGGFGVKADSKGLTILSLLTALKLAAYGMANG
jgi:hypothetical protein